MNWNVKKIKKTETTIFIYFDTTEHVISKTIFYKTWIKKVPERVIL